MSDSIALHCMYILYFIYPFICSLTLELFPSFWLVWIMLWTLVYKILFDSLLSSLWDSSGIVGYMLILCLTFLRNCQTVFQSGWIILPSHQQCTRVPHPHLQLAISCFCFDYSHPNMYEVVSHWFAFPSWLMILNNFSCASVQSLICDWHL